MLHQPAADALPDTRSDHTATPFGGGPLRAGYALLPGSILALTIAAAAYSVRQLPGLAIFSPVILAVAIGVIFANVVGVPAQAGRGIAFCQKTVLRFAIVLLGFQVTFGQIAAVGLTGLLVVVAALVGTMAFTLAAAKLLGVEPRLAQLLAAGTSICGASAIVAANSVVRAGDEDVAYAVASITLFGTVAMLVLPLLAPFLGLDAQDFGLWAGASIHEVAQVVGAGFQHSDRAGETATLAKLARVVLLPPIVLWLAIIAIASGRAERAGRIPVPWFVFGFLAVVVVNSLVEAPAAMKSTLALATTFLLSTGLAAMGLQAGVVQIRSRGLRPMMLAFLASAFICLFSLALIELRQ